MGDNVFRTDFSTNEIREAMFNYVKVNKKGNFDEIYASNLKINNDDTSCWYCKSTVIKNVRNKNKYGFFCSVICDEIFYGNIWSIFNYVDNINVNMIPFNLIKNIEDMKYLIEKTKKFDSVKGFFSYYKGDYTFFVNGYDNHKIVFSEELKIILNTNNEKCMYCHKIVPEEDKKVLNIRDESLNFCSIICEGSYSKMIERYFPLKNHFNIFLVPLVFFKDIDIVTNTIINIDREHVYGGFNGITDNEIKISILTRT